MAPDPTSTASYQVLKKPVKDYLYHRYSIEWSGPEDNKILKVKRRFGAVLRPTATFSKAEVAKLWKMRFVLHILPYGTFMNMAAVMNRNLDESEVEELPVELFAAIYLRLNEERSNSPETSALGQQEWVPEEDWRVIAIELGAEMWEANLYWQVRTELKGKE